MSNPKVTFNNSIPVPADPSVERTTYTQIVYDEQKFFIYALDEWNASYTGFTPEGAGERSYWFLPLDEAFFYSAYGDSFKPEFISDQVWNTSLKSAPSGFVTAVNSIMPKIMVPSEILVDNGSKDRNNWKVYSNSVNDLFNWELTQVPTVTGHPITDIEFFVARAGDQGSHYLSSKGKSDSSADNVTKFKLESPINPPTGEWISDPGLVVHGAFCIMVNVTPTESGQATPTDVGQKTWNVQLEIGDDITIILQDSGAVEVQLRGGDASGNTGRANLSDAQAKEGPPQKQKIVDKNPYIFVVYPVWNGIVLSAGVQDSKSVVDVASVYVPLRKKANILDTTYKVGGAPWFDPENPDEVEINTGAAATNVKPEFGDNIVLTTTNCRVDFAYLPCFFSHRCWFDEFFLASVDNPGVQEFDYDLYPIWTKNGTASSFLPEPSVNAITFPVAGTDTEYKLVQWRLQQDKPNRWGGEIFGSILRVDETQANPINNGNGNFQLTWTPGSNSPGDPSPGHWTTYVQTVTATIGLDGSSGQITVDKFGVAGQDAEADQDVGAVKVYAEGANGTVDGWIFWGLGIGVNNSEGTDGATWTIPLFGLERKLDEISLITPPFFDGFSAGDAFEFMAKYAGLVADYTYADTTRKLSASEDIASPIFDFKVGTTVRDALNQICDDILHTYVVHSGKIYFYDIDPDTSLPYAADLGPDWEPSYPNTKVMNRDLTPDFEDIRNEIIGIGLDKVAGGTGTELEGIPLFPKIELINQATDPSFPWSKPIVMPVNGYVNEDTLETVMERIANLSKKYEISGSVTIPGNADIKPYDKWGSYIIISVTHTVDMTSKSWTTSIELATGSSP